MNESAMVWAILRRLLRAHRSTVIGYVVVVVSAVVGARLGEAYTLWFYLLAAPLALAPAREVSRTIVDRRTRRAERERVLQVPLVRGSDRHVRRDDH
jgi:hypothetical protein